MLIVKAEAALSIYFSKYVLEMFLAAVISQSNQKIPSANITIYRIRVTFPVPLHLMALNNSAQRTEKKGVLIAIFVSPTNFIKALDPILIQVCWS